MNGREALRVTLLTPEWPGGSHAGGVARYAHRLARDLQGAVDLSIVTIDGDRTGFESTKFLELQRPSNRFSRYYGLPLKIEKRVAQSKPDVVHSFGDDWGMRHRWPLVRTFHGSALGEARSSRGLRKANHYLLSGLEHLSARKADLRIAVGGDSMREFQCDVAMPPVTPIQRTFNSRHAQPTAVFIGSFGGRKRGWMVAEAISEMRRLERVNARLIVIGPKEDAQYWPDWVEHRSGLDDEAVQSEVAAAWVLAAPSEYEGFGIPAYEALALGTPVVTSPTPGSLFLRDLLDGTSGLNLVLDAEFTEALLTALRDGPRPRSEIPFGQVAPLIAQGGVERLVEDIYPTAQRVFQGSRGPRV